MTLVDPCAAAAHGLSFAFAGSHQPALLEIDLELPRGSCTLVLGPSGSGKSTLLRALTGLIPSCSAGEMQGEVTLGGESTRMLSATALAGRTALLLQSPDEQLLASTVAAELAWGLQRQGRSPREISAAIEAGLSAANLLGCDDWPVARLSGGQKQRLLLAALLSLEPPLLALDEPLSQLDAPSAATVLGLLRQYKSRGGTLLISEHRAGPLLAVVDRVVVLDGGRIVHRASTSDGPALRMALASVGTPEETPLLVATTPASAPSATFRQPQSLLATRGLAFGFGPQVPLWRDVSFELRRGEAAALVGANGAGKSTLLHALAGLQRPTGGSIERNCPGDGQFSIALLPQNPDLALFCANVADELAFAPQHAGRSPDEVSALTHDLAEQSGLAAYLARAPQALSQGERLRLALSAALSQSPQLLLLDEPTTGQDPRNVARIAVWLRKLLDDGRLPGLLFVTHDPILVARLADRVLVLGEAGLKAEVSAAEFLQSPAHRAAAGWLPLDVGEGATERCT